MSEKQAKNWEIRLELNHKGSFHKDVNFDVDKVNSSTTKITVIETRL